MTPLDRAWCEAVVARLQPVFDAFRDVPVVSISNDQRKPLPQANYAATIYHGLPETLLTSGATGELALDLPAAGTYTIAATELRHFATEDKPLRHEAIQH